MRRQDVADALGIGQTRVGAGGVLSFVVSGALVRFRVALRDRGLRELANYWDGSGV